MREYKVYAIPVSPGTDIEIKGPFLLTEEEWSQLKNVLEAMKPGLVSLRLPDDAIEAQSALGEYVIRQDAPGVVIDES